MTRVLGVDGGQSAIRLRDSDRSSVVEVPGVSRAEGDVIAGVAAAVAEGWRRGAFEPVDRVVLGLTTAPADASAADRLCGLVAGATGAPEIWLADDAVTAHAGALSLGWGVSLVAGTGVACLAVPRHGPPGIIGGHGFLLGDEGGAFWLGARGLGAVLRAGEGRGAATTLRMSAERRFGPVEGLPVRLHDDPRPIHEIAAFAPDVLEAARAGDAVAGAIVDAAADELADIAAAAVDQAGGEVVAVAGARMTEAVPLALGGRLLEPGGELRRRLDARIADRELPAVPRTADASPLDGAISLGLSGDPGRYVGLIHVWTRVAVA